MIVQFENGKFYLDVETSRPKTKKKYKKRKLTARKPTNAKFDIGFVKSLGWFK